MDLAEQLVLLGAGLAAGVMASTVGNASIVSFPTLVALGLAPVTATCPTPWAWSPAA